jgi:hypothetical protein
MAPSADERRRTCITRREPAVRGLDVDASLGALDEAAALGITTLDTADLELDDATAASLTGRFRAANR